MNDTHEHPDNKVVDDFMVRTQNLMLLRQPFPERLISKLPKPTRAQTDEVKADFKKGARCEICGGWHHPKVVHLDYVGHAALTDRLLDADLFWSWEPVAWDEQGLPRLDKIGGLWLRLTVCGRTMLGYGSAPGKEGGDAIKELIGDGLRNAAMRMGGALELWFKGDLHPPEDDPKKPPATEPPSEKPALKAYVQASFDKGLPSWTKMILDGKQTAASIIAKISSAYVMTDAQKKVLHEIKKPEPTKEVDAEWVDEYSKYQQEQE